MGINTDKNCKHVVSVNEGSAISLGVGYYLAKKKFTGLYESYQRFSLEIEKFQNQDNYRIEYIEKLMNIPFLIVDDVFNGYENSEYKSSKFHDILLVRYEAKKPTLITAENMDNMSNQLISRIRDKNFEGESIAEGEVPIKTEKSKIKKKKRFIFF